MTRASECGEEKGGKILNKLHEDNLYSERRERGKKVSIRTSVLEILSSRFKKMKVIDIDSDGWKAMKD